ncbi:hypothetical protein JCM31598_34730 [Desulfonatronum parangueonense]
MKPHNRLPMEFLRSAIANIVTYAMPVSIQQIREKDLDSDSAGVRRYDCIDAACHDKSFRRKPESSAGE